MLSKIFYKLKRFLKIPISCDDAMQIANSACETYLKPYEVHDRLNPNWSFYNYPDITEPCWFVVLLQPEPIALRSCTVMVISRKTGQVLYCGSANDEG